MSALLVQMMLDTPAGLWPLNEASGTQARDLSGNGRHGTYTGGFTLAQSMGGGMMRGVALNGTTGYVTIPGAAALSAHVGAAGVMTVEAWSEHNLVAGTGALVSDGIFEYRMHASFDSAGVSTWNTGGAASMSAAGPAGAAPAGILHHIAVTYTAAAPLVILYIDGVEAARSTTKPFNMGETSQPLNLGRRPDGTTYYAGREAFAAYYGAVLSPARIKAHYEAGIRSGVSY